MASPSNVKPALLVLGMAAIFPTIIAYRVYSSEDGLYGLRVSQTAILSVLWLAQIYYHTVPFFTTPLRNLPRPAGEHFVFGNAKAFLRRPPYGEFVSWSRNTPNNGLILLRGVFHLSHSLVVTTPAALADVLVGRPYDYQKPSPARRFLSRVLGHGLVVVEGPEHKVQRKNVTPAFSGKVVKELVPLFWSKSLQMVDIIAAGGDSATGRGGHRPPPMLSAVVPKTKGQHDVEIGTFASKATLDIIGKACFGRDLNTLVNKDNELAELYELILDPDKGALFMTLNILGPDWLIKIMPWKKHQDVQIAAKQLRTVCRNLIAEKKAALAAEKAQANGNATSNIDILSVLMRSGQISDDGLVDQMLTFLAAGHETTSNALTWTTYLLSIHPDVQKKLREELLASPLANGQAVSSDIVDSLPYLHAVCAETLRIYPTVPVTSRVAVRTTEIQGQLIPKGTQLFVCPFSINRGISAWGDDADNFQPDRWLDPQKQHSMTGYDFITFIHGPRSCIGQGFARSELKCLLAALVLRFDIKLMDPDYVPELAGVVTMKPKKGMWLRLTEIA